ncbi:multi-sensor signal transduction histidine kinase [Tolypothrix sp. NIES-4075]|uniref:PAS domain-containing sensor histidine kinase n=1 Tax=Tolypothrix sp. NIES-4075 TaxID=2005459 RepID=UPI000B5C7DCB|nr:GAF domain-containing protein [Tolypothrix sp. NIES-4075]GAX39281.1 multi-sensor signal transduction histidine kinase [Tolypothrix sp. NIES-4075]
MNINPLESTAELIQASPSGAIAHTEESTSEQLLLSMYDSIEASIFVVDVLENGDFRYVGLNPTHSRWTGIRKDDLRGKTPEEILSPVDAANVRQHYSECVRCSKTICYEQCLQFQGIPSWWKTTLTPLLNSNSRIYRLIGTSKNITAIKQAEAGGIDAQREEVLEAIAKKIHSGVELQIIINQTVKKIRFFLESDRVIIYRFQVDWSGVIIAESTVVPGTSLLGTNIKDACFSEKYIERYKRGGIQVLEDIYAAGLHPCQIDLLASFQVKANVVVPILLKQDLWGLLIVHHCRSPRQWQQTEIDLLKQIATQLGIAVQQTELKQQIENLKAQFNSQMQLIFNYEAVVRRITEKIRDSLDETQLLQTVTQELAKVLKVDSCQIEFYNNCCNVATVAYEYTTSKFPCQESSRQIADFPEIYQKLLQKEPLQFVQVVGVNPQAVMTLACPIFDAQRILGNLWLTRQTQEAFAEFEIQLVQQIANECAIAICQARLYKAAQAQVKELEKLKHLKKDFLRTLSHELRTPITSISLAAQTLESVLQQEGVLEIELVPQLFGILQNECERESKLINDLLTLTYLEADIEPMTLIAIDLQTWLPSIVEPFRERIYCQQQQLSLSIAKELPSLQVDITDLERAIVELLNNACKYTPGGEAIAVSAYLKADTVCLSVSNTGVEIPSDELSRIFDPFYRIPKNDPWKYGGTGLGLALVKKMVKHLKATIYVESADNKTTFTIQF